MGWLGFMSWRFIVRSSEFGVRSLELGFGNEGRY